MCVDAYGAKVRHRVGNGVVGSSDKYDAHCNSDEWHDNDDHCGVVVKLTCCSQANMFIAKACVSGHVACKHACSVQTRMEGTNFHATCLTEAAVLKARSRKHGHYT